MIESCRRHRCAVARQRRALTIGAVNIDQLTADQLAIVAAHAARERDYLGRLRDRMLALGFPAGDPLFTAASTAWSAVSNLTVTAASAAKRKWQAGVMQRKPWAGDGPG